MRITILSPYYPPEMGAPPARLSELSVRLQSYGHSVTVVTAFPSRPQGRVYEGYRGKFRMIETIDGVRVIRTWIKPSTASASLIGRTINDLSFTFSSGLMAASLLGRQDVIIVQNPPLFSAFSAYYLKKRLGAKMVMWCGDVWPDVLLQAGQQISARMAGMMRWMQQYGFSRSDLLALTNPAIAVETSAKYCCPPVTVWSNGVDTQLFSPEKRSEELRTKLGVRANDLLVGYVGLHGRFQGLDAIVDAAAILKETAHLHFLFIGEGVEKERLEKKASGLGLLNVRFLPPRPKAEMPALVASCDVSVVPLLARMPGTMPSKCYEALAAGSIVLTADGCEAAYLVNKNKAGLIYEPMDAQSVATALMSVMKMSLEERRVLHANARKLSLRFDREKLARFVEATLVALVGGAPLPEAVW